MHFTVEGDGPVTGVNESKVGVMVGAMVVELWAATDITEVRTTMWEPNEINLEASCRSRRIVVSVPTQL